MHSPGFQTVWPDDKTQHRLLFRYISQQPQNERAKTNGQHILTAKLTEVRSKWEEAVLTFRPVAGCFGRLLSFHFTLNFDTKLKIMERSRKTILRHPFQMSESN